jgi:hypothetical protein
VPDSGPPIADPYVARFPHGGARTSGYAVASLVSSLLGYVCLPAIGGLAGVVLGIAARSQIQREPGKLEGGGLALAGIALGAINAVATVLGAAALLAFVATAETSHSSPPPAVVPAGPVAAPAPLLPPSPAPAPKAAKKGAASRDTGVVVTEIGGLTLVDVGRDVASLRGELRKQQKAAAKSEQTLLLWLVAPDCKPCNGVAASLSDPKLQEALTGIRVVRLDVRDFGVELSFLGVPIRKIPGFVLLGPDHRPVDYVHGGEWDDDIADNIAPVLGKFVRGKYAVRRDHWRGAVREDAMPI